MAAVVQKNRSDWPLAAFVLLIGASRHYGWMLAEPSMRGIVSKALGGVATLCLLGILWTRRKSALFALVLLWYAFEEFQVIACSVRFAVDPWVVPVGQSICTALLGFDLGTAGIVFVGLMALGLQNGD